MNIKVNNLESIIFGSVMLQKWNNDKKNFDVVYTTHDIFYDEEFYHQFGEMTVSQMYSFADGKENYLVIVIE